MSHPVVSIIGTVALIMSLPWVVAAVETPPPTTSESFLQQAAWAQQQEIELGHLAMQKAESEPVKRFGARMVTDHQKARQEVQHLASKGGLQLVGDPSDSHTAMKAQLEATSQKGFDRAYITLVLREHAKDVKELEQRAREDKNQEVRQWAAGKVTVVKEHLATAKTIASSLGVPDEHIEK